MGRPSAVAANPASEIQRVARTLALLALSVATSLGCGSDSPGRPDLVLISFDRLAADRLACFGGPPGAGTSLCELAQSGTLFAWATTPSLDEAAAAASALTGLSPAAHEVDGRGLSFLADAHRTLAEELTRGGYSTAAFVSSPRLNRSRRLDQGFAHYSDRALSHDPAGRTPSSALAAAVQGWIERARSPFFVWIHARSETGLAELDRLVDRLAALLQHAEGGPAVLLVAFAGEPEGVSPSSEADPQAAAKRIALRSHRIPLLWRPPASSGGAARPDDETTRVSWRLASLLDVSPTLLAAARLPRDPGSPVETAGRDLTELSDAREETELPGKRETERFLLLRSAAHDGEIAVASGPHLYARPPSPLDGSGRPVPTPELPSLSPRFLTLRRPDAAAPRSEAVARLDPGPWRQDVLSTTSPVPRLEFHLARLLAAEAIARKD